jgi:putative RNA 2'-phosphotransferase
VLYRRIRAMVISTVAFLKSISYIKIMISEKENIRISKFLSLVLRHKPETINLTLDENGWTDVATLLAKMNENGFVLSNEILQHVVKTNAKSRFAFNDDRTKIRASQGHSVDVELGYEPKQPPSILFHGTAESSLPSIFETGLEKRSRHHVHLSADTETATKVGQRYGKPVLLRIAALEMFNDGHQFYLSDNNVWLTNHVPLKYIKIHIA